MKQGAIYSGIAAFSVLAVIFVGEVSVDWARRIIEFTLLMIFGMVCIGLCLVWKTYQRTEIAHGVRTRLATIAGLGAVLETHDFTPESEAKIREAIVREAQQGVETLDLLSALKS